MEVYEEKSLYQIDNIDGVLQKLFTRGQFDVRPKLFLNPGDFPEGSSTFVREAHGKKKFLVRRDSLSATAKQAAQATGANVSRIKSSVIPNVIVVLQVTINMQARTYSNKMACSKITR